VRKLLSLRPLTKKKQKRKKKTEKRRGYKNKAHSVRGAKNPRCPRPWSSGAKLRPKSTSYSTIMRTTRGWFNELKPTLF